MVDQPALDGLIVRVQQFGQSLEAALRSGGLGATVLSAGPLLGLYVGETNPVAPTNYAEAKAICGGPMYAKLFHALLERGVALAPGAYEVLFPSFAHSDEDFSRTLEVAAGAARFVVNQ